MLIVDRFIDTFLKFPKPSGNATKESIGNQVHRYNLLVMFTGYSGAVGVRNTIRGML
jgi:hypothetical protein